MYRRRRRQTSPSTGLLLHVQVTTSHIHLVHSWCKTHHIVQAVSSMNDSQSYIKMFPCKKVNWQKEGKGDTSLHAISLDDKVLGGLKASKVTDYLDDDTVKFLGVESLKA